MSIDCQKCAQCCKGWPNPYVADKEIETITKKLNLSPKDFSQDQYREILLEKFEYETLISQESGDCIFLEHDGEKYSCKIYEIRPKMCRDYPFLAAQVRWCEENRTQ